MTDPDRFLSLLEGFRAALGVLDRYRRDVARERLLSDVDTQNMVLFALYRAVQHAIDLGQHVIAERGLPVPTAYREVFKVLADAKVIDAELGRRLAAWGGLRNIIAHQYGALDLGLVASALEQDLGELEAFATAIALLVEREG